jgi:hypothetical protein
MQLDATTGKLVVSPKAALFLRGPIPLDWLGSAAALPGKTLNVGIALWWLHGMAKGKPFKLTQKALQTLNVERDAASAALVRLEQAGLIRVVRKPGQRPMVSMAVAGTSGRRVPSSAVAMPNTATAGPADSSNANSRATWI